MKTQTNDKILDLVRTNVYSRLLSDKLLIIGSCIADDCPDIVDNLSKGKTCLKICLEDAHMNTAIEKIASMISKGKIKEINILTKDGSPHCIGLHFAAEWAKKMTNSDLNLKYYVIEHGKLFQVSEDKIKEKRHLSR
jgi:hypothetical protein